MSSRNRAFTLVELLAVVAIIGILVALLIPAVLSALESSRQMSCRNNLRQLALAVQQYEIQNGLLPPGRDATEWRQHSWATAVLPYLESHNLFQRYDYKHRWDYVGEGVDNRSVAETDLKMFVCPTSSHEEPGATDYGGNYGSSLTGLATGFGGGRAWDSGVMVAINAPARVPTRTSQLSMSRITDGTGQTFLIVEDAGRAAKYGGQWANGHNCLAHEFRSVNVDPRNGIYSYHPGGASVCMVDASVHFVTDSVTEYVIGGLCTRAHEELALLD